MRTSLLPFALFLFVAQTHGQLTAGEEPVGASAYDLFIDLSLNMPFTNDSAEVELDCDDFLDAWAELYSGFPGIDAPNYAVLDFVDTDIEVCMDMNGGFQQRPKYHAFGDTLDCSGAYQWMLVDEVTLGDYGGLLFVGPGEVDSLYIAYRRGTSTGWIQLSYDLMAPDVSLQVHRVLSLCSGANAIDEAVNETAFGIFPNPTSLTCTLHTNTPSDKIIHAQVFNDLGHQVLTSNSDQHQGAASLELDVSQLDAGIYQVLARTSSGIGTQRLVVH